MSPIINLNLQDAESSKPVAEGPYDPCMVDSFEGPMTGPKAKYLKCIMRIADDGDWNGRKLYINLPIEGAGAGITADFASKVTGEEIDVDNLEAFELDTDELLGEAVGCIVRHKEWPEGSGEQVAEVAKTFASK